MSLIGFFVSIGVISNLLLMYVSFDFFSIDAYITIFLSYGIIFIQMMIIPIDISLSTTKNINSRFTKDQMHNFLKLEYMILYWISIILNFVFLRFQLSYWNQGHPTLRERVIATLKSLSKLLMIFGIVFLIILLIAFIKFGANTADVLLTTAKLLNYVYCFIHCIVLLGYGLIELPYYIYEFTNTSSKLENLLKNVESFVNEYQKSMNQLFADKIYLLELCTKVKNNKEHQSREFAISIEKDLIRYNITFNNLVHFSRTKPSIEIESNKEIDNDELAAIFVKLKENFFYAKKKEAALLRLYIEITKCCFPQDKLNSNDSQDNVSSNTNESFFKTDEKGKTSLMIINNKYSFLVPKVFPLHIVILTKLIALIVLCLSLFILLLIINLYFISSSNIFEIILNKIDNFYGNMVFFNFIQGYMFMCCYYALTKFKITEDYILIPHHTNRFGLANNSGMCSTISMGLAYYFVFVFGGYYKNGSSGGALTEFFQSMTQFPLIYNYFNFIFPTGIFVIFIFIILKKFNLFESLTNYVESSDFYNDKNKVPIQNETDKTKTYEILIKVQELYYMKEPQDSTDSDKVSKMEEGEMVKYNNKEEQKYEGFLKLKKNFFSSPTYYFILKESKLFCYEEEKSTKLISEHSLLLLISIEITDDNLILHLNKEKISLKSAKTDESSQKIDLIQWKNAFDKFLN